MPAIDQLVRLAPFEDSPLVPRQVIGRPEQRLAVDLSIRERLDAMAARVGLHPVELTEASLEDFLPGLPQPLLDHALTDVEAGRLSPASAIRARRNVARSRKRDLVREIGGGLRAWRRRRLYAGRDGKPACLVSWLSAYGSRELAAGYILEVEGVAATWGLEARLRPTFWFSTAHHFGIELCVPGRTIVAQDEGPDGFEWPEPNFHLIDPGDDAEPMPAA